MGINFLAIYFFNLNLYLLNKLDCNFEIEKNIGTIGNFHTY